MVNNRTTYLIARKKSENFRKFVYKSTGIKIVAVGSLRRKCEMVGDLDFLVENENINKLIIFLAAKLDKVSDRKFVFKKMNVHIIGYKKELLMSSLLIFTGSNKFFKHISKQFEVRGFLTDSTGFRNRNTNEHKIFNSEKAIFDFLGMPYLVPQLRDWKD